MSIDFEKIEKFVRIIKSNIKKLKEIASNGKESFVNDFKNHESALRLLQISIESMTSIGNHIIARKSLGSPDDYAGVFECLKNNNIINDEDFKKFSKMVKFRNRIVHIYWDVDLDEVFTILENNLDDFTLFIKKITELLNENNEDK